MSRPRPNVLLGVGARLSLTLSVIEPSVGDRLSLTLSVIEPGISLGEDSIWSAILVCGIEPVGSGLGVKVDKTRLLVKVESKDNGVLLPSFGVLVMAVDGNPEKIDTGLLSV